MGAATDITQRAPTLLGELRELGGGRYLRNKHSKDSPRAKLPAPSAPTRLPLSPLACKPRSNALGVSQSARTGPSLELSSTLASRSF